MGTSIEVEPWRTWLRGLVLVGLMLWMGVSPALRYFVGPIASGYVVRWTMFRTYGADICDVRYLVPDSQGELAPIDWQGVLAKSDDWYERRRLALHSMADVERTALRLCRKLDVDDLRARVRCGSSKAWVRKGSVDTNLCMQVGEAKQETRG